ncbi:hypothetical protein KY349_01900, partial [Candidatus Woesearchaeota archaeon]|nr:hypothetical protein [Candidatus Woesearchaeota archaeon]
MKKFNLFLVLALFGALLSAQAWAVSCGDTITSDTTLEADLTCTGSPALTVAAGVKLDCDGYTIDGGDTSDDDVTTAIVVSTSGAEVRDCRVENYDTGVAVTGSNNEIKGNKLFTNYRGISVDGNSNEISDNLVSYGADEGIILSGNYNTLDDNLLKGILRGIESTGTGNKIINNVGSFHTLVEDSDDTLIKSNLKAGSYWFINISNSPNSEVVTNTPIVNIMDTASCSGLYAVDNADWYYLNTCDQIESLDLDGIPDEEDNCLEFPNPDQSDVDGDCLTGDPNECGDACDPDTWDDNCQESGALAYCGVPGEIVLGMVRGPFLFSSFPVGFNFLEGDVDVIAGTSENMMLGSFVDDAHFSHMEDIDIGTNGIYFENALPDLDIATGMVSMNGPGIFYAIDDGFSGIGAEDVTLTVNIGEAYDLHNPQPYLIPHIDGEPIEGYEGGYESFIIDFHSGELNPDVDVDEVLLSSVTRGIEYRHNETGKVIYRIPATWIISDKTADILQYADPSTIDDGNSKCGDLAAIFSLGPGFAEDFCGTDETQGGANSHWTFAKLNVTFYCDGETGKCDLRNIQIIVPKAFFDAVAAEGEVVEWPIGVAGAYTVGYRDMIGLTDAAIKDLTSGSPSAEYETLLANYSSKGYAYPMVDKDTAADGAEPYSWTGTMHLASPLRVGGAAFIGNNLNLVLHPKPLDFYFNAIDTTSSGAAGIAVAGGILHLQDTTITNPEYTSNSEKIALGIVAGGSAVVMQNVDVDGMGSIGSVASSLYMDGVEFNSVAGGANYEYLDTRAVFASVCMDNSYELRGATSGDTAEIPMGTGPWDCGVTMNNVDWHCDGAISCAAIVGDGHLTSVSLAGDLLASHLGIASYLTPSDTVAWTGGGLDSANSGIAAFGLGTDPLEPLVVNINGLAIDNVDAGFVLAGNEEVTIDGVTATGKNTITTFGGALSMLDVGRGVQATTLLSFIHDLEAGMDGVNTIGVMKKLHILNSNFNDFGTVDPAVLATAEDWQDCLTIDCVYLADGDTQCRTDDLTISNVNCGVGERIHLTRDLCDTDSNVHISGVNVDVVTDRTDCLVAVAWIDAKVTSNLVQQGGATGQQALAGATVKAFDKTGCAAYYLPDAYDVNANCA